MRDQLFRRRQVAVTNDSTGLKRTLGPVQLTTLGIGAIIGAGILGLPLMMILPAMLAVTAITVLLCIGIFESARVNAEFVAIKLGIIALFLWVGIQHFDTSHWKPFAPNGWDGVVTGAALIFFAYIGFDAVSTTAEEAKNPQRDLPIGILVAGGVWWLRFREPDLPRSFRVPARSFVAPAAMASCIYLMLVLPRVTWERFGLWLGAGLLIYFIYSVRHSVLRQRSEPAASTAEVILSFSALKCAPSTA